MADGWVLVYSGGGARKYVAGGWAVYVRRRLCQLVYGSWRPAVVWEGPCSGLCAELAARGLPRLGAVCG